MPAFAALEVRAGPRALARLREGGIAPGDVRCMPGAAGGPKGLALLPLDRRLAEAGYVARGVRLVGASIGAWRMAALASEDPVAAIGRLRHAYVHAQRYRERPSPGEVSRVVRGVVRALHDGRPPTVRHGVALEVVASRSRGPLAGRTSRAAFARVALDNAVARPRLARHLQRVVFAAGIAVPRDAHDAFGAACVPLDARNAEDALLASGSIPLVMAPVRDIAGAPAGDYWDGGLVDYHLLLPYANDAGLVLYPHFVPWVTPGWLDKFLPWRRAPRAHAWLSNVIVVAPSRAFLATLPSGRLPDRRDFHRYGTDHDARERDWNRAIDACERFADEAIAFLAAPNAARVAPL